MKNRNKNHQTKTKRTLQLLAGVLAAAAVMSGCSVQKPAAGSGDGKAAAIAAYQELLKASPAIEGEHEELYHADFGYEENLAKFGMHYDYFMLADLDRDGVPELIAMTIINSRWTPISVFTYRDGAVLLKDPADPDGHATFEQMSTAGGEYTLFLCRDHHLHNVWSGDTPVGYQEEMQAYGLTDKGLTEANCALRDDPSGNPLRFSENAVKNTEANRAAMTDMKIG